VRLLLDANLSPRVAESLRTAGFDAVHVADLDLVTATDDEIFDRAASDGLVVVTADSDFGALLALRRAKSPSVVHLRHVAELVAEVHTDLLVANLPQIAEDLDRGVIVSLSPTRLAIRIFRSDDMRLVPGNPLGNPPAPSRGRIPHHPPDRSLHLTW